MYRQIFKSALVYQLIDVASLFYIFLNNKHGYFGNQ